MLRLNSVPVSRTVEHEKSCDTSQFTHTILFHWIIGEKHCQAVPIVNISMAVAATSNNNNSKTVRFKEIVRVRRVPTRSSISAELKSVLWVSRDDIFNKQAGLKLSDEVVEDLSKLYLDGLESSQEKIKRHDRQFRAMQSVLVEQEKLWREREQLSRKSINAMNLAPPMTIMQMEQQIALQYSKIAAESADLARERAVNQAHSSQESRRHSIFDRLRATKRSAPRPSVRRSTQRERN